MSSIQSGSRKCDVTICRSEFVGKCQALFAGSADCPSTMELHELFDLLDSRGIGVASIRDCAILLGADLDTFSKHVDVDEFVADNSVTRSMGVSPCSRHQLNQLHDIQDSSPMAEVQIKHALHLPLVRQKCPNTFVTLKWDIVGDQLDSIDRALIQEGFGRTETIYYATCPAWDFISSAPLPRLTRNQIYVPYPGAFEFLALRLHIYHVEPLAGDKNGALLGSAVVGLAPLGGSSLELAGYFHIDAPVTQDGRIPGTERVPRGQIFVSVTPGAVSFNHQEMETSCSGSPSAQAGQTHAAESPTWQGQKDMESTSGDTSLGQADGTGHCEVTSTGVVPILVAKPSQEWIQFNETPDYVSPEIQGKNEGVQVSSEAAPQSRGIESTVEQIHVSSMLSRVPCDFQADSGHYHASLSEWGQNLDAESSRVQEEMYVSPNFVSSYLQEESKSPVVDVPFDTDLENGLAAIALNLSSIAVLAKETVVSEPCVLEYQSDAEEFCRSSFSGGQKAVQTFSAFAGLCASQQEAVELPKLSETELRMGSRLTNLEVAFSSSTGSDEEQLQQIREYHSQNMVELEEVQRRLLRLSDNHFDLNLSVQEDAGAPFFAIGRSLCANDSAVAQSATQLEPSLEGPATDILVASSLGPSVMLSASAASSSSSVDLESVVTVGTQSIAGANPEAPKYMAHLGQISLPIAIAPLQKAEAVVSTGGVGFEGNSQPSSLLTKIEIDSSEKLVGSSEFQPRDLLRSTRADAAVQTEFLSQKSRLDDESSELLADSSALRFHDCMRSATIDAASQTLLAPPRPGNTQPGNPVFLAGSSVLKSSAALRPDITDTAVQAQFASPQKSTIASLLRDSPSAVQLASRCQMAKTPVSYSSHPPFSALDTTANLIETPRTDAESESASVATTVVPTELKFKNKWSAHLDVETQRIARIMRGGGCNGEESDGSSSTNSD